MRLLLICVVVVAACGAASAQEIIGGPSMPDPIVGRTPGDPPVYSRSVTGTVLSVDGTRRYLTIERADRSRLTFAVDQKLRARADKGTVLAGRKGLALRDYQPGHIVKVSYRVEDKKIIEIRLKGPKT